MLQDASNPKVSSEANLDIGRVPTKWHWVQLVYKDMWLLGVWDEVKQAYEIDGFIEPLSGTSGKKELRFWISSVMVKSTRRTRMILDNYSSST